MKTPPLLNTYRTIVIVGYVVLVPLLVYILQIQVPWEVSIDDLGYLLLVLGLSVVIALLVNRIFTTEPVTIRKLSVVSFISVCCYALAFAVPEEILFRVLVQGFALSFTGDYVAICISSLVYGLAHLPNGATGVQPRYWNWRFALVTSLLGLPLGWLYYITGSITLPIVLHALYIIMYKMVRGAE